MPKILGVDIPTEKRMEASLPYIFGIGPVTARRILDEAKISYDLRGKDLTDDQVAKIVAIIQAKYVVEGDLRRDISENIKRLSAIGAYRGIRHRKGLPVRGQRTRTNARTRKGRRPSVGGRKRE